jgi:hypothetical protein
MIFCVVTRAGTVSNSKARFALAETQATATRNLLAENTSIGKKVGPMERPEAGMANVPVAMSFRVAGSLIW